MMKSIFALLAVLLWLSALLLCGFAADAFDVEAAKNAYLAKVPPAHQDGHAMESGKLALIDRPENDYGIKRCRTASNSMGQYCAGDFATGRELQVFKIPASSHFTF